MFLAACLSQARLRQQCIREAELHPYTSPCSQARADMKLDQQYMIHPSFQPSYPSPRAHSVLTPHRSLNSMEDVSM